MSGQSPATHLFTGSHPVGGGTGSGLATPERRAFALHCVRVLSYLLFSAVLKALSLWEGFRARTHERLCKLLRVAPSRVFEPRESAIVIIGGDDDVGRHVALNFSELGYAVFVLSCPTNKPASPKDEAAQDAPNVFSLIHEWHKRIQRSGRPSWGLVAPIVLDMTSGTERARAFETVDAYCTTHNLHLAAVFVLSATAPAPLKPAVSGQTDVSAWAKIVRQCLVDPITVVQDYAPLLATASGRVVVLLASGDQLGMGSAHLVTLESAAQFLRQQLSPLDIKVAIVSTGPFARMSRPPAPTGGGASRTLAWGQRVEECGSGIRSAIEAASQHFFVRYEDVWTVCHNIVRSRYPKDRYTIGLHAGLRDVLEAMPTAFRLRFCSHSTSGPTPC